MPKLPRIPRGHTVLPRDPVSAYPAAWELEEGAGRSWPAVSAFEGWNDEARAGLRDIAARTDRMMPGLPPERLTRRFARLAVRCAVASHGVGLDSMPGQERAVAIVESMARRRKAPSGAQLFELASMLVTGGKGTGVRRTKEALVFNGADAWHSTCPADDLGTEMRGLLGLVTGALRTAHDPGAVSAWVYREVCFLHPLEDGNGRLARALASGASMAVGGPPLLLTPADNGALVRRMGDPAFRVGDEIAGVFRGYVDAAAAHLTGA